MSARRSSPAFATAEPIRITVERTISHRAALLTLWAMVGLADMRAEDREEMLAVIDAAIGPRKALLT